MNFDAEKLQIVAHTLKELGAKDKTYSSLMTTLSDSLLKMVTSVPIHVKEVKDLHLQMDN